MSNLKQVNEYKELKEANSLFDKVKNELLSVNSRIEAAHQKFIEKYRNGKRDNTEINAKDEIDNILSGASRAADEEDSFLYGRKLELEKAARIAASEVERVRRQAERVLLSSESGKLQQLRKNTLAACEAFAVALEAEDNAIDSLQQRGVEAFGNNGGRAFFGFIHDGEVTSQSLRDLINLNLKDMQREELLQSNEKGVVRIKLLNDSLINGEWFAIGSVIDVPTSNGRLMIFDGQAESTGDSVKVIRGKTKMEGGTPAIWS